MTSFDAMDTNTPVGSLSGYVLDDRALSHGFKRASKNRILRLLLLGLGRKNYERLLFRYHVGYFPDIEHPVSVNEKIAHLKLLSKMPDAPLLADKVAVREHVAKTIGPQYLTQALLVTRDPAAIDFAGLPDSFIAKVNHGSGMSAVVLDKSRTDPEIVKAALADFLQTDYGTLTNEWWYARIARKIILEEFLQDGEHLLPNDYRLWVFHGETKFIQVTANRFRNRSTTFYDADWRPQSFRFLSDPADPTVPPIRLGEMIELANTLGKPFDMVRIDLCCVDGHFYFGEMTVLSRRRLETV
jgi:TupA-like ATPgrasp